MNKWLERALISAGAAVVSTTALVTTAEKPGKKKKKKKKKKGKDDQEGGRGQDGALIDDDVPRSIGAQAAHDYRVGHDGGLTGAQFLDNVRSAGTKAKNGVGTLGSLLFSRQPSAPDGEDGGEPTKKKRRRKKVRRRVRRDGTREPTPASGDAKQKKKKRKKRRGEPERDELDELAAEAKKAATRAAAKGVADKVGMGDTVDKVREQSRELWEKTERLSASVREKVPDDLGQRLGESLEDAGKSIKDGANKLSDKVKEAVGDDEETGEDLGDKVGRGLRGFVRWVEGPGAPEYDAAPKPTRVRPVSDEGEASEGAEERAAGEPTPDDGAPPDDAPPV